MSTLNEYPAPGCSRLERLPAELLRKILIFVALNPSPEISKYEGPNSKPTRQATSLPCLLTSCTLHKATLPVTYRDINISLPSTLTAFLAQIHRNPSLGPFIRSLDLSQLQTLPPSLIHSHDSEHDEIEDRLNPLRHLLSLTPLLRSFRYSPALQHHLTSSVLRIFFSHLLPHLETLDLQNLTSSAFTRNLSTAFQLRDLDVSGSIMDLNLSGCSDLPASVFDTLLSRLPRLRALRVRGTRIEGRSLMGMTNLEGLRELDLSDCGLLDDDGVSGSFSAFLTTDMVKMRGLEVLNLDSVGRDGDGGGGGGFLAEEDVTAILNFACVVAPRLRILRLRGSEMSAVHVPLLRRIVGRVEELSVGSGLNMRDLEDIFLSSADGDGDGRGNGEGQDRLPDEEGGQVVADSKYQIVLEPMEEAVAVCKLRRRINTVPSTCTSGSSRLRSLDVSSMLMAEQGKVRMSILLGPQAGGLERIQISEKVFRGIGVLGRVCRAVGWDIESSGRRSWIVKK